MFCWTNGGRDHLRGPEDVSKTEILRGIVAEKLSTAAKEILAVVERTVTGYEEEAAGLRRELDRQKKQLEVLLQPRVKLEKTDVGSHDGDLESEEDEKKQTQQSVEGDGSRSADLLWYSDGDDLGRYNEEWQQPVQQETSSPPKLQDRQDPDFQTESRPVKRKPGRPRLNDSNQLYLRIRLCDSQVDRVSNAVLKKCPLLELQCPRGLQEADFLQLLRSAFPQLVPHKHLDLFVTDRSRTLLPLRTRTRTPEDILATIMSSGAGKSALYIRLKSDQEEELHTLPGNEDDANAMTTEQEAGSGLRTDAHAAGALSQHAAPAKLQCHVCGRSYLLRGTFFNHAWSHVDEVPHDCGACGARLDSVDELKAHLRNLHQIHDCSLCGKSLSSLHKLDRHMAAHALKRRFKCDACDKTYARRAELENHRWVHAAVKPHTCGVCGKSFGLKVQLKYHSKTHGVTDKYQCRECGRTLGSITSFQRHRASHLAEPRCVCEVCGKRFKHSSSLKAHLSVHAARDRRYLCEVCCKTFLSGGALKRHLLSHGGERSFVCDVCGKGFLAKGDLKRHTRVHSDAAPHGCSQCGRFFKSRGSLKMHAAGHSGVRQFVCKVCGKGCARQDHLTVHMRTHNGERPYGCPLCDRAFTQSHCLKTHMRSHQTEGHEGHEGRHSRSPDAEF